ncbi:MAG: Fur family transcriptional regulator [Desulfovibrionaceae bacterium]|nr:Fur family transcriptional regulator [Desulfovibrionaceae bacterium]
MCCKITDIEEYTQFFQQFLQKRGLRQTTQRKHIAEIFFKESGHLSVEDLYIIVRESDPSVGQATVYRTIKLLCEAGLAWEVRFYDGIARYEHVGNSHHDHLICEICGQNIEVVDPAIEVLQEALMARHGFTPTRHRLYLYGICPKCQAEKRISPVIPEKV